MRTVIGSAVAFAAGTGGVLLVLGLLRGEEELDEARLLLIGTQGNPNGLSTYLVDPETLRMTEFQLLPDVRDVVGMSLSPDEKQVLVLCRSEDGKRGQLVLLRTEPQGTLARVSSLELPGASLNPTQVAFLGDFPHHSLAMVSSEESGCLDVIKVHESGLLELTQHIQLTPHPETGEIGAPQRPVVISPYIAVPVAGINHVALFSLAGDDSFEVAGSLPLSSGAGPLRLLFSRIHQKGLVVNQAQGTVEVFDWKDIESAPQLVQLPPNQFAQLTSVDQLTHTVSQADVLVPDLLRTSNPLEHRAADLHISDCLLLDSPTPGLLTLDVGQHSMSLDELQLISADGSPPSCNSVWSAWSAGLGPQQMCWVSPTLNQLFVANQKSGTVSLMSLDDPSGPVLNRLLQTPGASCLLTLPLTAEFDLELDELKTEFQDGKAGWKMYELMAGKLGSAGPPPPSSSAQ